MIQESLNMKSGLGQIGYGERQSPRAELICSLDKPNLESRIGGFHLDTLWVAEVVPHLGLPVL